jgi:hypothetical protein
MKFHFTSKFPSMFRSSCEHLSFTFSNQNPVRISHILYMRCKSHTFHPPWFHQSKISGEGTNHKFPHYPVSSVLLLLPPLRPKYLPQHPFLQHPQPLYFPLLETKLHIHKQQPKQDRQRTCKRDNEARFRNQCYRGKALSIIYIFGGCVYSLIYPASKAHAPYYRPIANYGFSGSSIFSTLSHKQQDFRGKKRLKVICLLWFSLQLSSEMFVILRRIRRVLL